MLNHTKRHAIFLCGPMPWVMGALIPILLCGAPHAVSAQDDHQAAENQGAEGPSPAFLPHPVMAELPALDEERVVTRSFNLEALVTSRVPDERDVIPFEDFKIEFVSGFGENKKIEEEPSVSLLNINGFLQTLPTELLSASNYCILFKKLCKDKEMKDVLLSSNPGNADVKVESQDFKTNIRGAISVSALDTLVFSKPGYQDCTPQSERGFVIFRANGQTFVHCDLQPILGASNNP